MYARVIKSESLLVVVEKVIFIDEILDTVQDQFSKILEQMGRHWSVVIYYLLRIFLCTWNYVADMYKNIGEMIWHFKNKQKHILVNILFIVQNNTLKFQEKYITMVMINLIPLPLMFFVQGGLRCKNNILLHFHPYWQCMEWSCFASSIFWNLQAFRSFESKNSTA